MKPEDINKETLTAVRRALAGAAIAAVAVFGAAACEDPEGADEPTVDNPVDPGMEGGEGDDDNGEEGGGGGEGDMENNENN